MEKSEDETNTDNNAYNSIRDDTIDENIYAIKSSCKGIEKNSPLPCSKTDFTRIIRRKGMYLNKCCIDAFHILYQISSYH